MGAAAGERARDLETISADLEAQMQDLRREHAREMEARLG